MLLGAIIKPAFSDPKPNAKDNRDHIDEKVDANEADQRNAEVL